MARAEKEAQVSAIASRLADAKAAVLADYRGLTVAQMDDLRTRLRAQSVEVRVVKNTLARRAAVASGHEGLVDHLKGPLAIVFGYQDISAPSRLIAEWTRSTRNRLDVVGGLVEGRVLGPDAVRQVADLPPREVLLAQLLGTLQSPIAQLVGTIQAPVQQLVGLLEAYKTKLEAA